MSTTTLLFFVAVFAFCVLMAKYRVDNVSEERDARIRTLEAELIQAKMKNASYRGKIGSLSRKLKDSTK